MLLGDGTTTDRGGGRRRATRSPRHGRGLAAEAATAARRLALPAIALAAGMILLGLLVVHVLARGRIGAADLAVDRELAGDRVAAGNTATSVLTALASTPVVIALTALAAVGFRLAYRRWHESVFVVCCVAGETLIFLLTTLLVHRARPPVAHLDVAPPTSDYPSGHTAAAVCFYGAVAAVLLVRHGRSLLAGAAVTVAVLLPPLVAFSRLYRGMHFPTDVLAGLLLGATWLTVSSRRFLSAGAAR
jgi:membrane-associated phospholipid phosphatase